MNLVTNGRLITRDTEGKGYYEHGARGLRGQQDRGGRRGSRSERQVPRRPRSSTPGAASSCPALINAHTHIYSALARGLSIVGNNPTNFYEVLDGTWWAIDRHLMMDGTRASATALYIDSIKQGVTTIFDHHASYWRDPRHPPHHRRGEQAPGPALLPVLRGQRPGRRGEVPAGRSGERRLHHLLREEQGPHAGGHVRRPRPVHHLRQDL